MKKWILLMAALALTGGVKAQERAPIEEARKAAQLIKEGMADVTDKPLKIEIDLEKPQVLKAKDIGILVVPPKDFSEKSLAKLGKEVTPIGEMWMLRIVPAVDGKSVASDKLRHVSVTGKDQTFNLSFYQLGAQKNDKDGLDLVIYSKDKKPLLTVPLQKSDATQEFPLELDGRKEGESSGVLTINVVGKYKANVSVMAEE